MASSEMDLVKEIPGYKMILKAVLKGQIQQLVQQLATHTDEESIILTACVGDGAITVSHLGSDVGKMFLGENEDIKSQFVGFCLKNHNIPLQDETAVSNDPHIGLGDLPWSPKVVTPKQQGGGVLTKSSAKQRHEPYSVKRFNNRKTNNTQKIAGQTEGSMVSTKQESQTSVSNGSIKVEVENPENEESLTRSGELCDQYKRREETFEDQSAYQNEATFQREAEKDNSDICNTSSQENSKLMQITPDSLFVNSCFSTSLSTETAQRENQPQSSCESDIKLEAISESEMELEITGIVPGNGNKKVKKKHSADITSSPKGTAVASSQEYFSQNLELVSGQLVGEGMSPVRVHICDICRKPFPSKWELGRHRRTHTGEKPFTCEYCNKAFSDKSNMNQHIKGVHFRQPFRKDR